MMEIIQLTNSGVRLFVMTDKISRFYSYNGCTLIVQNDLEFTVDQTPEEILNLMYPKQQSTGPK